MKGSRDNVIWRCRPVLVSVHAECASERGTHSIESSGPRCSECNREKKTGQQCSLMRSSLQKSRSLNMKTRLPPPA